MFFGEPFGGIIPGARGAVLSALLRTGVPLTGRQIHGLVSDKFSLWTVQEALKEFAQLGLVETRSVGRAGVHVVNEAHAAIPHLRALAAPVDALKAAISEVVDSHVQTVLLFGSVARGEAAPDSDVDLAVIALPEWDGRSSLEDIVHARLGNACDTLVFTQAEFERLARDGEPVVADILRDGVALVGSKPRVKKRAA